MEYYENKEDIINLENKVASLENKISKLEEFIMLNIKKKYNENNIFNYSDNINYNKQVTIPYLRRMNAFYFSDTTYFNNDILCE
jgi:2-iminoacetate synthase ThiH